MRRIPNLRWFVAAMLFLSTVINYMDRQNLSILARTIQNDLKMSDIEYSWVVQAFLLAYTISYIFAGRITDKLGTRVSMAVFIVWWSLADMMTSLARSVWSLGFFRFLLGMGEPGNYTAAPKAVSEWFPAKERGLVIGLYTAGATLGATIAPPVIAWLATQYGWRPVFLFTGSLGLIWVIPWLMTYRRPEEHPRITEGERTYILGDTPAVAAVAEAHPWRAVLRRKETWLLLVARLITDPVWYFYLFWFPKYLNDGRGLTLLEVGKIAWLVYLAADIGCIVGGYLSGYFIKRGMAPIPSRLRVMMMAVCLLPLSPLVVLVPSAYQAVGIAALAVLGHLAWQVTLGALLVDLFPKPLVGTVFGLVAAGSGFGGMLSTNLVGRVVTYYSYSPLFIVMGFLHPLALLLALKTRPKGSGAR